jgi:hypothetical protein
MPIEEVYVLGAGASYVHGAPLTNELIPYALAQSSHWNDPRLDLVREFLRDAFHFRVPGTPPLSRKGTGGTTRRSAAGARWLGVPNLVDVLSVVDVALDRKESLAPGFDVTRLRKVRHALEFAIFEALEDSLSGRSSHHRTRRKDHSG